MSERIEISGLILQKKGPAKKVDKENTNVFQISIIGRLNTERNIIVKRSLK